MTITAPSFLWLYAMIGLLYMGTVVWCGAAQQSATRIEARCKQRGVRFHSWAPYFGLLIIGAIWPVFLLIALGQRR